MRIQSRPSGSMAAVVELAGKLTAGPAVVCLCQQVDDLLRRNLTSIVLNMQSVELVDCAGIGQLVNCFCKAREQGGRLKLAHVRKSLHELLVLFRLEYLLETSEAERVATASLAASCPGAQSPQSPVRAKGVTACLSWGQV